MLLDEDCVLTTLRGGVVLFDLISLVLTILSKDASLLNDLISSFCALLASFASAFLAFFFGDVDAKEKRVSASDLDFLGFNADFTGAGLSLLGGWSLTGITGTLGAEGIPEAATGDEVVCNDPAEVLDVIDERGAVDVDAVLTPREGLSCI